MVSAVPKDSDVSLDLTHGLRHLPMLGFSCALCLRSTINVKIKEIYSGALDMRQNEITPVLKLTGLMKISEWFGAVQCFNRSHDYGVFSTLLPDNMANPLKYASFQQGINEIDKAKSYLDQFDSSHQDMPLIASLFMPRLKQDISWMRKETIDKKQHSLARTYLKNGEYMLATILGFESFITSLVTKSGLHPFDNYDNRNNAKTEYESRYEKMNKPPKEFEDYRLLRALRNKMVHGTSSNMNRLERAIKNEESLKRNLTELFDSLKIL
jgi:CRISPR-associated DxTHG motif protein